MSFFSRPSGKSNAEPGVAERGIEHELSFGLSTLLELFENDHEAIAALLEAAISSIERDVAAIDGAALTADGRRVMVEAAHRIKGTSGSIGAAALIAISSGIEATISRTGDAVRPPVLDALRDAVQTVRRDIASFRRTGV